MPREITHLVFDLGGVIVELRGTPILSEWLDGDHTDEALWEKWLTSNAPRAFEAGKINKEEFAIQIVKELYLNTSEEAFLQHFTALPVGPYPGALPLLHSLKESYTTALFSNSNDLHWQRKMNEMQLKEAFHHHFASHLMGKVKPDADAFEEIISTLAVPAEQIMFFDDNQLNVEAAKKAGIQAVRVKGFTELSETLARLGTPPNEIKSYV